MPPAPDFSPALRHLRRADPRMAALIKQHGPPTFRRTNNAFRSLGEAIIYQQLSGSAAGTIYRRFLALFPGHRFPAPAVLRAAPFERLRSVGLSRQKASYLLDLADKFLDGTVTPAATRCPRGPPLSRGGCRRRPRPR